MEDEAGVRQGTSADVPNVAFGTFHLRLVFFTQVWYFLLAFGIICLRLVFFTRVWHKTQAKISKRELK